MGEPRTFYGGDPVIGAAGGEIGVGHYDGPEAHLQAPWKCPACGVQNEGPLQQGCVHCGSGKPGYHVGLPPPAIAATSLPAISSTVGMDIIEESFRLWHQLHHGGYEPDLRDASTLERAEAFRAGWIAGAQNQAHHTMTAPPVTADLRTLAPHTKAQRTIIAALELFRDQVLGSAEEEIAAGEWCSVAEVEALIGELKAQL